MYIIFVKLLYWNLKLKICLAVVINFDILSLIWKIVICITRLKTVFKRVRVYIVAQARPTNTSACKRVSGRLMHNIFCVNLVINLWNQLDFYKQFICFRFKFFDILKIMDTTAHNKKVSDNVINIKWDLPHDKSILHYCVKILLLIISIHPKFPYFSQSNMDGAKFTYISNYFNFLQIFV